MKKRLILAVALLSPFFLFTMIIFPALAEAAAPSTIYSVTKNALDTFLPVSNIHLNGFWIRDVGIVFTSVLNTTGSIFVGSGFDAGGITLFPNGSAAFRGDVTIRGNLTTSNITEINTTSITATGDVNATRFFESGVRVLANASLLHAFNSSYDAKVSFERTNIAFVNESNVFTLLNTFADMVVNSIFPQSNILYSLGNSTNRFSNAWFHNTTAENITVNNSVTFISSEAEPSAPPTDSLKVYSFLRNGIPSMRMIHPNGTVIDFAQDNVIRVRNTQGSTVNIGDVIYVDGATGGTPNVKLARADSESTLRAVGIMITQTTHNSFGIAMFIGRIENFNTASFAEGATLFVSDNDAGKFTSTRPAFPNFTQPVGVVLVSGVGNGAILVTMSGLRTGRVPIGQVLFGNETGFFNANASLYWNNSLGILTAPTFNGTTVNASDSMFIGSAPVLANASILHAFNSTYDAKPSNTFNSTYDAKPSNTFNSTYDAKPSNTFNSSYDLQLGKNTTAEVLNAVNNSNMNFTIINTTNITAHTMNTTWISANRFFGMIDCSSIDGGSDSDYCVDATGAGGGNTTEEIRKAVNNSVMNFTSVNVTVLNATNLTVKSIQENVRTGVGTIVGLLLSNRAGNLLDGIALDFSTFAVSGTTGRIAVVRTNTPISGDTEMRFSILESATLVQKMVITSLGRVGIGTTSPGSLLDVRGTINATGINTTSLNSTFINTTHVNASGTVNSTQIFENGNRFPQTASCSGTDKVRAFNSDGTFTCATDQTGAGNGGAPTDARYFVGQSNANLPNAVDIPSTFSYFDDMTGATLDTSRLAVLGTATVVQARTTVLGAYNVVTGTTAGNDAGLSLGATTTTNLGLYNFTQLRKFEARLNISTAVLRGARMVIGLVNTDTSQNLATRMNGTFFNLTGSGYWNATVCDNGLCTRNNTGVSSMLFSSPTNFTTFTIQSDGKGRFYEYYINRTLISNLTTNINSAMGVSWLGFWVETNDTTLDRVSADYLYLEMERDGD